MKILALDTRQSWHAAYAQLFASPRVQSLLHDLKSGSAAASCKYSQIECCEDVTDQEASILIDQSLHILQSNYTHIAAFHGCRISNPDDYWNHGILISDFGRLVNSLIRCAPEYEREIRDAAMQCADHGYRNKTEGRCCFYLSGLEGLANTGCYSSGSEYIRRILNQVNSRELRARYFASGVPSLVSVHVPVPWLFEAGPGPVHKVVATQPLIARIQEQLNPNHQYAPTGGFKIRRPLPPSFITSIDVIPCKSTQTL